MLPKNRHNFDFTQINILNTELNEFKRKTMEMIHIRKSNGNTVNFNNDIDQLSQSYSLLFSAFKQKVHIISFNKLTLFLQI